MTNLVMCDGCEETFPSDNTTSILVSRLYNNDIDPDLCDKCLDKLRKIFKHI